MIICRLDSLNNHVRVILCSSAIASLVGAPRVLQAVAKDKLFPYIEGFSKGHGANNDPFRGYILVFLLSLVCVLIGDLDYVSRYKQMRL